jgi:hypothetical protein
MFVVGLLLFTVPFWAEVRQSRPRLIALLRLVPVEAALAPPPGPSRSSAMSRGPSLAQSPN